MEPTLEQLYDEGWSLIPIRADKRPAIPSWKKFQTERASLELIHQWEDELRPAIWAGVTGAVSGVFTLDFDGEPGRATLEKLGLDPHRATPRDGFHVDFRIDDLDVRTLNSKSKTILGEQYPGLDVRGEGGYINLLGSTDNGRYRWLTGDHSPYSPSLIPAALMDLITLKPTARPERPRCPTGTTSASIGVDSPEVEVMVRKALERSHHGRNEAGFWLACQLRDIGMSRRVAADVMRVYYDLAPSTDPTGVETPYWWGEALASLESAYSFNTASRQDGLPEVVVNGRQLSEISDDAFRVLVKANDPPVLFRRLAEQVTVQGDEQGRARIEPLSTDLLRHHLSRWARWVKVEPDDVDDDGNLVWKTKDAFLSKTIVTDVQVRPWDEIPALSGVVETPVLRPDGSMLSKNGYDPETALWMDLPEDLDIPPVSDVPDPRDVDIALGLLDDAVGEFCFADRESKANALGLILSTVFRASVPGLIPMAVIDAPTAGSGKSHLADLTSMIAFGRTAPMGAAPNGNDEELRKRITALLMTDEPLIVFDNVDRQLRSPILAQAITSPIWSDRKLGYSQNVEVQQHSVWVATGNNVEIGGDLPRRCYLIRLDPRSPQPARRQFARADLLKWAKEHRGELLWACFTLARHWYQKGCPKPYTSPWAGFEPWKDFIGGIIMAAGVDGFLGNLAEVQDAADPDVEAWGRLLAHWRCRFGDQPVSSRQLAEAIEQFVRTDELPRGLSESLDRAQGDQSKVGRLTRALGKHEGRYFSDDGLRIERAGRDGHDKVNLWRIVTDGVPVPEAGA